MNPVLAQTLESRRVLTPDGSSLPLSYGITLDEGLMLQDVIRQVRPRITLEIGLGYGISTLFICEALRDVGGERHIVIDPGSTDDWLKVGLFTIERAGFSSLVDFRNDSSHRVLPELERDGTRVGVALIDGWHTLDYVLVDFFYVDRILDVGGVVMFDDTEFYPAIRKVTRYVATHRRYQPLPNAQHRPVTRKRALFNLVTAPLRSAAVRRHTKHLIRPEVLQMDSDLGLPPDNHIAFRKAADDLLGDGSDGTRKWDQHFDF